MKCNIKYIFIILLQISSRMNSEGSSDASSIPIDDEEEEDPETRGNNLLPDLQYTVDSSLASEYNNCNG